MIFSVKWFFKILIILFSLPLFWTSMEGSVAFSYENKTAEKEFKLTFGTPVLLRFTGQVTSESYREGEVIRMEVGANVYKDGVVVIPEGLPANGVIISGGSKRYAGEGGKLTIGNFYLVLNNSQRIRLDGIIRLEGKNKKASLVLGQCCPLGYLIKGEEANIEKGQTFRAVLKRDEILPQHKKP